MFPLGAPSIVNAPSEHLIVRACPLKDESLFVTLGPLSISLWSFSPFCLLSHYERDREIFLKESDGSFKEIHEWNANDWKTIDVILSNGRIERFKIVDTPTPILPAVSSYNGFESVCLKTPKYALVFGDVLDAAGRGISNVRTNKHPPLPSMTTASKLCKTKDSLIGQFTSGGFFIFELGFSNNRSIALKDANIIVKAIDLIQVNRMTSVLAMDGLLAVAQEKQVCTYDLSKGKNPFYHSQILEFDEQVTDVLLLDEYHILVMAKKLLLVDLLSNRRIHISLPKGDYFGLAAYAMANPSFIVLIGRDELTRQDIDIDGEQGHDQNPSHYHLIHLSLAKLMRTCGSSSRHALFLSNEQIVRLRMPKSLFTGSIPFDIRDNSLAWEFIDIPIESYLAVPGNEPIRLSCVDSTGNWIAVAGGRGLAICNLVDRTWKLFENPKEEASLIIEHMTWINVNSEQTVLLAAYCKFIETGKSEFLLFWPEKYPLSLAECVYRQKVSKEIVTMSDCGAGILAILQNDSNLQLIHLVEKIGQHGIINIVPSLVLSASLAAIIKTGSLQTNVLFIDGKIIVHQGQQVFLITIPIPDQPIEESQEIRAKLIFHGLVRDLFFWEFSGITHLIISSGQNSRIINFFEVQTIRQFEIGMVFDAFYPKMASGLGLVLDSIHVNSLVEGDEDACRHKIQVSQTESLAPHLLLYLIRQDQWDEINDHLTTVRKQYSIEMDGEFRTLIEILLSKVLTASSLSKDQQGTIFTKLKGILFELLHGGREYRGLLASFLRMIEFNDAQRIMSIMGPFNDLFVKSINGEELLSAWSFFRIQASGDVNEDVNNKSPSPTIITPSTISTKHFEALLIKAYEKRHSSIFRGVLRMAQYLYKNLSSTLIQIREEIIIKRDWIFMDILDTYNLLKDLPPLIEIKPSDDEYQMIALACLMTRRNLSDLSDLFFSSKEQRIHAEDHCSDVASLIKELTGDEIEAAYWSLIVDGDPISYLGEESGNFSIKKDEFLSTIDNNLDFL